MDSETSLSIPEGWTEPEFKPEDNKHRFLEESSFSTLFPKYREKYIQEVWLEAREFLKSHAIRAELDLIKGSMTVRTTIKTRDPYSILNARDFIKVISRGVTVDAARKVFKDDCACEVIKIGSMQQNRDRFVKRRQRLIGKDGATLKALELLTDCYILIQGHTVTALGPHRGLKDLRKIVIETMQNIHPVYNIKALMIKQELAKNPKLKSESWDRFLPKFKKSGGKRKAKPKIVKKEYSHFPPPQPLSKMDKEMETGEFFLKQEERKRKQQLQQKVKQAEGMKKNTERRMKSLQPPKEKKAKKQKEPQKAKEADVKSLVDNIKKSKTTKKLSAKMTK